MKRNRGGLTDFIVERVLLTNDDGIDAQGIRVLEEAAAAIAREVWVVAPEHDQSGVSHSISLHHPLRVSTKSRRKFGVFGTPGDCVAIAVQELMRDNAPDLILSGIQLRFQSRRRDGVLRNGRCRDGGNVVRVSINRSQPGFHASKPSSMGNCLCTRPRCPP